MSEVVEIVTPENNPSLEAQAEAAGIDVTKIDSTATEQSVPERPSWLPKKFKSPEEMAKSYGELEKKLGGKKPTEGETTTDTDTDEETEEVTTEETPEVDPKDKGTEKTPEEVAKEATDKAGVDLQKVSDEYWEKGQLDAETYTKLDKAGFSKALVDQFIEGQVAVLEATRSSVFKEVGGESNYSDMLGWAKDSYTEAEVNDFNAAVNGRDAGKRMSAVKALKARFEASEGKEPTRVVEGKTTRVANDQYESMAQLQTDIRNPKYKTDPAFRSKVEAKLGRSDIM